MKLKSDYTYEELPEFTDEVKGAVWIPTTGDEAGVMILKDVEYCKIHGHTLRLQILIPDSRNSRLIPYMNRERGLEAKDRPRYPCLVLVQGSAWMEQDLYSRLGDYSLLARRGYVIAVAEYRHSGIASFPAQVVDTRNAIRFMKVNAEKYFVDADKILVAGNSSGGQVAMYSGIYHNDDNPEENLFWGVSGEVKGIINQFGSTDFTFEDSNPTTENHNMPDSPEGRVMGGANLREHPELAEKLSVKCNITPQTDIVPSLLLHGTKDRLVNCKCSVYLYEKLKKCGKDTSLVILQGSDHGGPEFFNDPALSIQEEFIKKCIGQE